MLYKWKDNNFKEKFRSLRMNEEYIVVNICVNLYGNIEWIKY